MSYFEKNSGKSTSFKNNTKSHYFKNSYHKKSPKMYLWLSMNFGVSQSLYELKSTFKRTKNFDSYKTDIIPCCHWFQKSLKKNFTTKRMFSSQRRKYSITISPDSNRFLDLSLPIFLSRKDFKSFMTVYWEKKNWLFYKKYSTQKMTRKC